MNKICHTVWNDSLGAWVAVSEISTTRGKSNRLSSLKSTAAVVLVACVCMDGAYAQTHYYSINDQGVPQENYANTGAAGAGSMAAGVNARTTTATTWGIVVGNGAVADGDRA